MSFMRNFRIPCHHTALLFVSSSDLTRGSLRFFASHPLVGGQGVFYGILEFPAMSSPSLTGGSLFCDDVLRSSRGMTQGLGNSRIPYYVILGLDPRISAFLQYFQSQEFQIYTMNSRICLRTSRFILRNSRFILGILEFCSLLGQINLAHKFYKCYALNPQGCRP